jgi:hypothetical protein
MMTQVSHFIGGIWETIRNTDEIYPTNYMALALLISN